MLKESDQNQLEDLLRALKQCPPLAHYSLTLYRRQIGALAAPEQFQICCSIVEDPLSRDVSRQFFEADMDVFFEEGTPSVCRYGGGFFGFLIPFSIGPQQYCLVGDGLRDASIDLWQLAALSRSDGAEVFSLLPQVESLRTATYEEVEEVANEVANEVARRIEQLNFQHPQTEREEAAAPEQADPLLLAVAQTLDDLDKATSVTASIALCCETVATDFQARGIAIALREGDGKSYHVTGTWGVPDDLGSIPASALHVFIGPEKEKRTLLFDLQMRNLLPAVQAGLCTSFPLSSQRERIGFLALFDTEIPPKEAILISMLSGALAAKLLRLIKAAERSKESVFSEKLMSLANTLLQIDSKEQLYEAILGVASELIDATQGSIMLIDKDGENMRIVFTLGMTLNIARCLPVKVGKGIAGMVAQAGQPLLVNDVETDSRVAMVNRVRFKSKSLICIPLKLKDKVIGVLNLSDKKNLSPFTDEDLQLLTSFANLASLMIERTVVLEESVRFEQLSVTDSLTGLYNRRFLKSRLEEELSRSVRQGLNLTILFIDLDFFKNYNDMCGHIAGDEALKVTADIIKASLRDMDIVARYGGEEFCAVLPGTSKKEAMIVAERIRSQIESKGFHCEGDIPLRRLTASLGVASFPEDGRTFTELVHASDIALYEAKASGRNRIVAAHTAEPLPEKQPERAERPATTSSSLAKTLDFNAYLEASLLSRS